MSEQATGIGGWRTASVGTVVAAAILALSAAPADGAQFKRCLHEHLSSRDSAGQTLPVTSVQVKRISCASAAAAVRASTFEATPGGPLFSTPGFICTGPVGPPPPHSKPRYYRCTRGREQFEFLIPGFS
ncbi:MAG TPA: hypothetical protein VEF89_32965 [Solirubrobacteraceae bacterium]|nr:hypothetical protein [Solirubrobacteraceae bacterium]